MVAGHSSLTDSQQDIGSKASVGIYMPGSVQCTVYFDGSDPGSQHDSAPF